MKKHPLRQWREYNNITVAELGFLMNAHYNTIWGWETLLTWPNRDNIRLLKMYKINMQEWRRQYDVYRDNY